MCANQYEHIERVFLTANYTYSDGRSLKITTVSVGYV
jgi:hypothetical protein